MHKDKRLEGMLKQLVGELRDDDGVAPRRRREEGGKKRRAEFRDRQLCAMVRGCLEIELPTLTIEVARIDCAVVAVEPRPDMARLAVIVSAQAEEIDAEKIIRNVFERVEVP